MEPSVNHRSHIAVQDLDLLAAAWGFGEVDCERILEVPPGTLSAWRNSHPALWNDEIATRIKGLKHLQDAIWLRQLPQNYAAFWRRTWGPDSPIGATTPLAAIIEGGPPTVALTEQYLISATQS